MKYTINTKSWHFWVACFLNDAGGVLRKKTICSYRWSVIWGLLRLFLLSSLSTIFIIVPFFVTLLHFVLPHTFDESLVSTSEIAVAIEISIALAIVLGINYSNYRDARDQKKKAQKYAAIAAGTWKEPEPPPPKEPGFVATAWASLKDRYCLPIEFEKDASDN